MSFTIEYDNREVDFAKLPVKSQAWLAREGFAHGYGNRVASKVIGAFRAQGRKDYIAKEGDMAWKALADSAQAHVEKSAIPASDSEEYRAAIDAARAAFMAELEAGTLSEGRAAMPKRSPLEVEMDSIARRETIEILTKQGLFVVSAKRRVPKAEDEFQIKSETVTFEDLCDRRLARFAERIEREAKKIIADREKAVAKVAGEGVDEAF